MHQGDNHTTPLSMKRNIIWNSIGSLFFLGCQWLITVLVVRLSLGFEAAGIYSLASSVFMMFQPIANYRMYTYQISDVSNENAPGEYLAFRLITCTGTFVFIAVYAIVTCEISTWLTILAYALWMLSSLFLDGFHAENQRANRMDVTAKSFIAQGISILFVFTLVFWLTHNLPITLLLMTITTMLIGGFYDFRASSHFVSFEFRISAKKARVLLMRCLPIVLGALALGTAPTICRQYLFFTQGESALGIYASVAAPVTLIQMGATYIYNPLLSQFALLFARGEHHAFARLFIKTVIGIIAIGILGSLFLTLFGVPLLKMMFGARIEPYGYLIQPLLLMTILTAFVWFLSDLLISIRDFRSTFIAGLIIFAVALVAMMPFIDRWGMNGVSFTGIAYLGASIAFMLPMLLFDLRNSHQKPADAAIVETE